MDYIPNSFKSFYKDAEGSARLINMIMTLITSPRDALDATNAYIALLFNRLTSTFRSGVSLSFTSRLIVNGFRPGKIRHPGK